MKFPKTGLGNMLLPWARGIVFAKTNALPFATSAWWGFKWGTLLRLEKKNRMYWGYFTETPIWLRCWLQVSMQFRRICFEPKPNMIIDTPSDLYVFNKIIADNDLFAELEAHADYIYQHLLSSLRPKLKAKLITLPPPAIGIHIRRGDFKKGSTLTTNEYFISGIQQCREILGWEVPVTIFTDAANAEIEDIVSLPNVSIAPHQEDILDILQMSKSRILFLSATSTFSFWAGFFCKHTVIRPNTDWLSNIKRFAPLPYQEITWDGKASLIHYIHTDCLKDA